MESTSSVMQTLLASPFTSDSNLITPTTIYCPYPNLVGDRISVGTDLPQYRPDFATSSFYKAANSNAHWKRPCGPYCPSLPRNTAEDKGIATFLWNTAIHKRSSTRRNGDYILCDQIVAWKLASHCRNTHCKRFVPPPSHGGCSPLDWAPRSNM